MHKIAVLLYPNFSLQEITTLTAALTVWFGETLDFLGSERKPYNSEEGFQVLPNVLFSEAKPCDYDCLILPGIIDPMPALYDRQVIDFLGRAKGTDTLIAAISSAPLLLAKAGLLEKVKFTAGFFMQMVDAFAFIPGENFVHKPVMEDKNIITGIGFAFREFAEAVLRRLGYDPGEDFMGPVTREYTPEELTFYWEEDDYREFLRELEEYNGKEREDDGHM